MLPLVGGHVHALAFLVYHVAESQHPVAHLFLCGRVGNGPYVGGRECDAAACHLAYGSRLGRRRAVVSKIIFYIEILHVAVFVLAKVLHRRYCEGARLGVEVGFHSEVKAGSRAAAHV